VRSFRVSKFRHHCSGMLATRQTRVMLRLKVQCKQRRKVSLLAGLAEGELIAGGGLSTGFEDNLLLRIRHIILASGGRVVRLRYRR